MAINNGHITAPIGLHEVAQFLGEPQDIYSICTSKNINPYSLIRPTFASSPNIGPEHFNVLDGVNDPVSPPDADWVYAKMRWGWFVPCVGNPYDVDKIKDEPWVHKDPVGDSFYCMSHFDGYRHNVKPESTVDFLPIPGDPLILLFNFGVAQPDAVSGDGRNNKGGVVSIPNVLGAVTVGCSVYRNETLVGHYTCPNPIPVDGTGGGSTLVTGLTVQSNSRYRLVPWATDGTRYFSLKYEPGFKTSFEKEVKSSSVALGAELNPDENIQNHISNFRICIKVTITNTYNQPRTVNDFKLVATFTYAGTRYSNYEIDLNADLDYPEMDSFEGYVSVPANSTKTIYLSTTEDKLLFSSRITSLRVRASSGGETFDSTSLNLHQIIGGLDESNQ
ncbi:MAG: hypothetical protein K2G53_07635 [Muribaculaceae bacterium]|nr:hypothetical protein [Muribaculaceae bacterium]